MTSNYKLVELRFAVTMKIMFCLNHNFVHATTAPLSWHVLNCGSNILLVLQLNMISHDRFHKSLVKMAAVFNGKPKCNYRCIGDVIVT